MAASPPASLYKFIKATLRQCRASRHVDRIPGIVATGGEPSLSLFSHHVFHPEFTRGIWQLTSSVVFSLLIYIVTIHLLFLSSLFKNVEIDAFSPIVSNFYYM